MVNLSVPISPICLHGFGKVHWSNYNMYLYIYIYVYIYIYIYIWFGGCQNPDSVGKSAIHFLKGIQHASWLPTVTVLIYTLANWWYLMYLIFGWKKGGGWGYAWPGTQDPCNVCYIYLHEWLIFMVPVGRDSIGRVADGIQGICHYYVSLPESGCPNPGSQWVNLYPRCSNVWCIYLHLEIYLQNYPVL